MSEIGIIINSEEIKQIVQEVQKEFEVSIDLEMVNTYEDSLERAKQLERKGCQVLISRGGHSRMLREAGVTIPIVDIPFTGSNVLSLIVRAKNEFGRFGILGTETFIQLVKGLEGQIDCEIDYFKVQKWEDFEKQIKAVKEKGLQAIVGGYDSVKFSQKEGITVFCAATSKFEVRTAIHEAVKVLRILINEKNWNVIFRTVLDNLIEGVVMVDKYGIITHFNQKAKKLLDENNDQLILGKPINIKALKEKVLDTIKNGTQINDELNKLNDYKYTNSIVPICIEQKIEGAVVVLQEVAYVHKIEHKIRHKLSQHGLVASKTFNDIIGTSKVLQDMIRTAKQYSMTDSTILISGESGTGKELFAQSIHNYGPRSNEAFVAINCATIPQNLMESELFGYAEGAFTGAKKGGKMGLFEIAHNGTIFLDEISEIGVDLQARLLRVLEEKEVMRVGDDRIIPINTRTIAATNKDLKKMVESGNFRADLYYRLNVLPLSLLPIRHRKNDIKVLVRYFLNYYSNILNKDCVHITPQGMDLMLNYEWPGNIREIKSVIERLMVTNDSGIADYDEVLKSLGISREVRFTISGNEGNNDNGLMDKNEKDLIMKTLDETGWNKTETAFKLGISRSTLYRKINKYL